METLLRLIGMLKRSRLHDLLNAGNMENKGTSDLNYHTMFSTRFLECWNCGEKEHKNYKCMKPRRMVNQETESLANVIHTQKLTREDY